MAKSIITALRDELQYPIKIGFLENTLIKRELDGNLAFTADMAKDNAYRGAVADCYIALIMSPNIAEGDMQFSLTYKSEMLKIANSIYLSIGEGPADIADKPIVYIEN